MYLLSILLGFGSDRSVGLHTLDLRYPLQVKTFEAKVMGAQSMSDIEAQGKQAVDRKGIEEEPSGNMDTTPSSWKSRLIYWEWWFCGMSDLWGRIESFRLHALWWVVRHVIYVGCVTLLALWAPYSVVLYAAAFILAVHMYKFIRIAAMASHEERKSRVPTGKAQTKPPSTPFEKDGSFSSVNSARGAGGAMLGTDLAVMEDDSC